jgi:transposase-like protein
MGKQRQYSLEFRERAVRRMKLGDNISRLARELGIDRSCLYIWKRKLGQRSYRRKGGSEKDWRDHRIEELEAKIARLEGIIGSQWWSWIFRECLAKDRGESAEEEQQWRESLHAEIRSRMRAQGGLSIQRMCQLAGISRASFYRHWEKRRTDGSRDGITECHSAIGHGAPHGYRRITVLLRRKGFMVGPKKVRRWMRQDNLLAIRRRKFVVTTDSAHVVVSETMQRALEKEPPDAFLANPLCSRAAHEQHDLAFTETNVPAKLDITRDETLVGVHPKGRHTKQVSDFFYRQERLNEEWGIKIWILMNTWKLQSIILRAETAYRPL